MTASFQFLGDLHDHLEPDGETPRQKSFAASGSVKDAIESFGVPHTEIEQILVNGSPVEFGYLLRDGDQVVISAERHSPASASLLRGPLNPAAVRFVLDVHLGRLAAYLRMLGFDTFYRSCLNDPELADISAREQRVLLTRDRGLLMRSRVVYGYWLRNTDSRRQTEEVLTRYGLRAEVRPWTRCMECNGLLRHVDKAAVLARIPPRTAELHEEFSECESCGRVYWKGSHFARMERWVAGLLAD